MLTVLEDKEHTEIFGGGCFTKNTPVARWSDGICWTYIDYIKKGDLVLSYNPSKKFMEYQSVLETFKYQVDNQMIRVKLNSGVEINVTANHQFLFKGNWIEIRELVRRILARDRRKQWAVFHKQQREIKDNELEEFWKRKIIQTSFKQGWLFNHSISFKRKECCSTDSQISGKVFHTESRKEDTSESQRLRPFKQPSRKSGMADAERELRLFNERGTFREIQGKHRKLSESPIKERFKQWYEYIKRISSYRNQAEVHTQSLRKEETCSRIPRQTKHYKGHHSSQELEASEINPDDIVEIEFYKSSEEVYDLNVAVNHNYVITKKNIIVHNSAGGQKSFTGCLWQIVRRLKYPGTRGFLARARLKSLKQSTLLTFFECSKMLGLQHSRDYTYNSFDGVIKFSNGSDEYLKDLFKYPSDPDFVNLGSTEYTDGFIDEMGEITEQAYNIMKSRIRFKLDENDLIPKIFMGSNPCKTFIYREFYQKWKNGNLESYKAYIPALVYDNPFISDHYIDNLNRLDSVNKARLLDGNWEYDADDSYLINYDAIIDLFHADYNFQSEDRFYLSCDPARFGKDRAIIILWQGWYIKGIWCYPKSDIKMLRLKIEAISKKYSVPRSHIVIDSDGVGGGLVDELEGCKGFVNGGSPIIDNTEKVEKLNKEYHYNFQNLKTQCAFVLADKINNRQIGCFPGMLDELKTDMIEELQQLKRRDIDKDEQKVKLVSKDDIKSNIGRSPDIMDSMIMRGFFELLEGNETIFGSFEL